MKSCDGCAECCRELDIVEIDKPAGVACGAISTAPNGSCSCKVYERKPRSCTMFHCLWLMSQMRPDPREAFPDELRPDKSHVIFYRNGQEIDPRLMTLHVDGRFPQAWHSDVVSNAIARLLNNGVKIVVEEGEKRIFLEKNKPTVTTDAETASRLAGQTVNWTRSAPFAVRGLPR